MVIEDLQCYFAFEYLDAFAAFVDSKDDKIWDLQCWKMMTEAADNNLLIARNGRQRQEEEHLITDPILRFYVAAVVYRMVPPTRDILTQCSVAL